MSAAIAYQGVPGAFSELAARAFDPGADALPCESFEAMFDALERGLAGRAAAPVENTLAGSVHAVYDLLAVREVEVRAETIVRVSHALVAAPGAALERLRRVYSHPVALQQCTAFFREHPAIEAVGVFDTAGAARQVVAGGRADEAALASERAAGIYGGVVLARELEDDPANFTRFLLVAPRAHGRQRLAGRAKTSLVFRAEHRPGALLACLEPLVRRGLDLTKIESRPLKGRPFEYLFYLDAVAPREGPELEAALGEFGDACAWWRRLGTYAPALPPSGAV